MYKYQDYDLIDGPISLIDYTVMHGANYYSGGPIVLLRIDLKEYDEVFTNDIPQFHDRLKEILPSLHEHHCSIGKKGGFLERVKEGTLLGHVTEHVAIELQTLAGMDVAYGKTRESQKKGVYNVIFRFFDEVAGIYAGKAAVNLVNSVLSGLEFNTDEIVKTLINIREERLLGPSTQAIVDEAENRKIPYIRLDRYNLVQIGTGKYQKRIRATITSDTNFISVETADNKYLTNIMLKDAGLPVPDSIIATEIDEIVKFREHTGKPLTIKPLEGYRGEGVSNGIAEDEDIEKAFEWAKTYDDVVIVQPTVDGNIYRLLVIDYEFCAASKLVPPQILGDGRKAIKELIEDLNISQNRGLGDKSKLTRIKLDDITMHILADKGFTEESILPENEVLILKTSGSMRLGSSAIDVTDEVHPFNKWIVERAAKVIGLNVAGVDVIAPNLKDPIVHTEGMIIEINAAPDFRMHINPTIGKKRNAPQMLVDMLFPKGVDTRVPVISVTGTVGKTIAAHLLNHCLSCAGHNVGLTSTEGLYIANKLLMQGDMTYPEHVNLVLKDPTIDFAVLETSKEGILRSGLGYEFADIGIVLNLYDDHIGTDDIKYIEDLAYAKSVVAEQVYDEGYAVLNADYALVLDMGKRVYSNLAYFSKKGRTDEINQALNKGSTAAIIENDQIIILKNNEILPVANLHDIPLTLDNKGRYSHESILAVVLTLFLLGYSREIIIEGLISFKSDMNMLPGRMNLLRHDKGMVILDYAHNKPGFFSLKEFISDYSGYKAGLIDIPGDRPDDVIHSLGQISAAMFDEIVFYEGYDLRGRKEGEITNLLSCGAIQENFPKEKLHIILKPEQAWEKAVEFAGSGVLTVILTGRPRVTYDYISKKLNMTGG